MRKPGSRSHSEVEPRVYRKPVCIDGLYQYVRLASNTKVLLIPRLPFVTPGPLKIEPSNCVDYAKSASGLLDAHAAGYFMVTSIVDNICASETACGDAG